MNITDTLRRENAVQRYDFWLDLRGVRRARRRELRAELRANLDAASADVGMTRALFGIGSPKQLAFETSSIDPSQPRWTTAWVAAMVTFGLVVVGIQWAAFNAANGVDASGVTGRDVAVGLFPWLGAQTVVHIEPAHQGLSMLMPLSAPWMLGLPLGVFLLVARPWRLLTARRQRAVTAHG